MSIPDASSLLASGSTPTSAQDLLMRTRAPLGTQSPLQSAASSLLAHKTEISGLAHQVLKRSRANSFPTSDMVAADKLSKPVDKLEVIEEEVEEAEEGPHLVDASVLLMRPKQQDRKDIVQAASLLSSSALDIIRPPKAPAKLHINTNLTDHKANYAKYTKSTRKHKASILTSLPPAIAQKLKNYPSIVNNFEQKKISLEEITEVKESSPSKEELEKLRISYSIIPDSVILIRIYRGADLFNDFIVWGQGVSQGHIDLTH